ncbi:MAG TPA: 4-vinyl reductase [Anaeromyxobacteraceae bacterium]|nr:4-vinyl reductase [Anaeromyxobacteraceae bacterium]
MKGTLIAARLRFIRARGPEMADRVLNRMSAEDQAILRGLVLPSSWYPANLLLRLEMTAAAIISRGDPKALFVEMGRYTAQANLGPTGVQRAYVRDNDPHFLLSNVPRMYVAQHTDGNRTYEKTGAAGAIIRSFDGEAPRPEDCLTTLGWMAKAIEFSGGRDVRVEEKLCRAKGAGHCEFHCRWV